MRLVDDRQPKGMTTSFGAFFAERHLSGDFKGITVPESAKLAAEEWKALSEGEKKVRRFQIISYAGSHQTEIHRFAGGRQGEVRA
jgi:hypothetical protein